MQKKGNLSQSPKPIKSIVNYPSRGMIVWSIIKTLEFLKFKSIV